MKLKIQVGTNPKAPPAQRFQMIVLVDDRWADTFYRPSLYGIIDEVPDCPEWLPDEGHRALLTLMLSAIATVFLHTDDDAIMLPLVIEANCP